MSDTAQNAKKQTGKVEVGKEEDHHPYYRPKDAATLILIDRSGPIPKVLVGKRSDRVVFMHAGRIHEIGPPAQIFNSPQTPELQQFLATLH